MFKCYPSDQLIRNTDLVTIFSSDDRLFFANYLNQFRYQWRGKNVEKSTHIKGGLLDQAVILFKCVPFSKWELLLKEREGANSFL